MDSSHFITWRGSLSNAGQCDRIAGTLHICVPYLERLLDQLQKYEPESVEEIINATDDDDEEDEEDESDSDDDDDDDADNDGAEID